MVGRDQNVSMKRLSLPGGVVALLLAPAALAQAPDDPSSLVEPPLAHALTAGQGQAPGTPNVQVFPTGFVVTRFAVSSSGPSIETVRL